MSPEVLMWFHDAWIGEFARAWAPLFTIGLVLHFIGICLLIGAMLVVDLRLLGFAKALPIAPTFRLLPIAIGAFAVNALTGFVFFCFDPEKYWTNPAFKIKMVLIALAGINALVFTFIEQRKLEAAPAGYETDMLTKISAGLSLFLWFAVILFGRLIVAFQGSSDFFT